MPIGVYTGRSERMFSHAHKERFPLLTAKKGRSGPDYHTGARSAGGLLLPWFWHERCFVRSMSIQPFTSESYCEGDRTEAGQDVLGGFGLRSSPLSAMHGEHATALSRAALDGVGLMRFAADPQVFSALPRRAELPIILLPAEDGAVLDAGGSPQNVAAGRIVLAPRQSGWQGTFPPGMGAVVF